MPAHAYIAHSTSDRLRIKIPSKKGDTRYFQTLKERFQCLHGIERVDVAPFTGSVLFVHRTDPKTIAVFAGANSLFVIDETERTVNPPLSRRIADGFKGFDKKIKDFTSGELDIPCIAFLFLVGLGVYQISIGNFTAPAWYTAFWYGMNIFLKGLSGNGTSAA